MAVVACALGLLAAPIWGHPTALPSTPTGAAVTHRVYVVQAGDTLAGIARQLDPGRAQGATVATLRAELHGAPLQPGDRLQLP